MRIPGVPNKAERRVRAVRKGIARAAAGGGEWYHALDTIVRNELWADVKGSDREPYTSFAACVVDTAPAGLGIRAERDARRLRHALLQLGHIFTWVEVLERIRRLPGRPRKNTVPGERFRRFYSVSKSSAAVDQILLGLKETGRTELMDEIGAGRLTAKEAGRRAGLVPQGSSDAAVQIDELRPLSAKRQARALRSVFLACSIEARCALIASELEPHLDLGLAARWRALMAPKSGLVAP